MTSRILVVEDELLTRRIIEEALRQEGFDTRSVGTLADARASLQRDPYDLILLDLMLPDGDGLDLCRDRRSSRTPIIVVTSRGATEDVVKGLDVGADDYVTKPIEVQSLAARVRAQLRRSQRNERESDEAYEAGGLRIDPASHEVTVGDRELQLSPREFAVLHYLAQRSGRAVGKDNILAAIWGEDERSEKILAVFVRKLREKIESDPANPSIVTTVRGVGYRFEKTPPPAPSGSAGRGSR
jgi:two-component system, OmpR family, response regulator RegX3